MEILALGAGKWDEQWPAIFLALLILATGIHEVGHLIAGWAVGFSFVSFQVGPVCFEREYGVLKMRFSFDQLALGHVGMFANKVRQLRRRSLIFIAGGPAANFVTVILVVFGSHVVSKSATSDPGTVAGLLAAISLVLAMISLVPLGWTDGAIIESLLCDSFAARRYLCTVALGAQSNKGVRARNWKQSWVRGATCTPDNSRNDFYASWMAYLAANDRNDADLAAGYLERCLSATPFLTRSLRNLVAQEAAVFSGWFRKDSELADKWVLQLKTRRSLRPLLQTRLEVAISCAQRDFEGAEMAWENGLKLVQQLPTTPSNQALLESWLEWRTEIQQCQAQGMPV